VTERFDKLEGRSDKHEGRFDKLEGRFDKLEVGVSALTVGQREARADMGEIKPASKTSRRRPGSSRGALCGLRSTLALQKLDGHATFNRPLTI
jgi:hypothetical protein